jgi:hypothetical protein
MLMVVKPGMVFTSLSRIFARILAYEKVYPGKTSQLGGSVGLDGNFPHRAQAVLVISAGMSRAAPLGSTYLAS